MAYESYSPQRSQAISEQLGELKRNGEYDLPASVKVVSSNKSLQKYGICAGVRLNIYRIQPIQVAILVSSDGKSYFLPFNSKASLSPVYSPDNDLQKALHGYTFNNISELVEAKSPPQVFVAETGTSLLNRTVPEANMEWSRIYCLREITKENDKVINIVCDEFTSDSAHSVSRKVFPYDMPCTVSTNPHKLTLPPSAFLQHQSSLLTAVLINKSGPSNKDDICIVTEIISSYCFTMAVPSQTNSTNKVILDVYDDVDMKLELVTDLSTSEVNLVKFEASLANSSLKKKQVIDERKFQMDETQLNILNPSNNTTTTTTTSANSSPLLPVHVAVNHRTPNRTSLNRQEQCFSYCPTAIDSDQNYYSAQPQYSINTTSQSDSIHTCTSDNEDDIIRNENKEILKDYSPEDVASRLLPLLNLDQYKDKFQSERICGSLLMELDDEILKNELQVTRRLDRIKLLVIIKGKRKINFVI